MKLVLTTFFVRKRDIEFYLANMETMSLVGWGHSRLCPEYHFSPPLESREAQTLTSMLDSAGIPFHTHTMTIDMELLESGLQKMSQEKAKRG